MVDEQFGFASVPKDQRMVVKDLVKESEPWVHPMKCGTHRRGLAYPMV